MDLTEKDWVLKFDEFVKGKTSLAQEALMTLGNGYLGWRGAPVWSQASDEHYPGLYLAGVFNQTKTEISGQNVVNEDLVNFPNPQLMRLFINDKLVKFDELPLVKREAMLDFKTGLLSESYIVQLPEGLLEFSTCKAVDPLNFHCLGFSGRISANFSANVRLESLIDAAILNQNVERYRDFDSKEFDTISLMPHLLLAKTRTTEIEFAIAVHTFVNEKSCTQSTGTNPEQLLEVFETKIGPECPITFRKMMAVATSNETANIDEFVTQALSEMTWEKLRTNSENYWKEVWETADIVVDSDDEDLQRNIRLNIFHIRQAGQAQANPYLDASIGSRGLTGESYRGHIVWDELFFIPYYVANDPETARALLRYRIKRLQKAQENAKIDGEVGAMYPLQSGIIGDEQAQFIHLNPVSQKWDPDHSRLQRHTSLAVVYNFWIYTQVTQDFSVMDEGGLEVLIETTKFWLNKVRLGADGRYHLSGVMGPDEYHEAYPDASEAGITDNAYTNLMLVWSLNWLIELSAQYSVDEAVLDKAHEVARKLFLQIRTDGVIAQYDGFFELQEVDFAAYKEKYGDIHRIDRLMKSEGISPDQYQLAKQADLLMTIYNLGSEKTKQLVEQLGYHLPENWLQLNQDYYLSRTVHGSSLSRPVYAGIEAQLGRIETALEFLKLSLGADLYDIQGGTTAEGIHLGVMCECLSLIQREIAGVDLRYGKINVQPNLPKNWRRVSFSQQFRGIKIRFDFTEKELSLQADDDLVIFANGQEIQLLKNQTRKIKI